MVKIAKSLLLKCQNSQSAFYITLLVYYSTPKPGIGLSPSQLFLERRPQTALPVYSKLLTPKITKPLQAKIQQRKQRVRHHYGTHAKALKMLTCGDMVRIQPWNPNQRKWEMDTISRALDHRSYEIQCDNGGVICRNHVQLRAIEAPRAEPTPTHHLQPAASAQPAVAPPPATPNTTRSGHVVKPVHRLGFI